MERLTKRIGDYVYYTQGEYEETLPIEMETGDVRNALKKLAYYEDLEEKLEKAYGECEGLLETVVFDLVKHEGVEIGTPHKARLLTDEDADKWEGFKNAEEQGMLLRLPCKVGDTVYVVGSKCLANVVQDEECNSIDCDKCNYLHENIVFERKVDRHYLSLIVFGHNENFIFGKTVFLTKEEADAALERLESAKAAKEKPTKSAEEHFRRKPYQKKGEKNG